MSTVPNTREKQPNLETKTFMAGHTTQVNDETHENKASYQCHLKRYNNWITKEEKDTHFINPNTNSAASGPK